MYMARVVGMKAGIPKETPAFTVNRLCGTGVQAIVSAAPGDPDRRRRRRAGRRRRVDEPRAVLDAATRAGARGWAPAKMVDPVMGGLTDPFHEILMGVTAENLAERMSISREEQDAFAVESHRRAADAREAGRFDDEIVPVPVQGQARDRGLHARRAHPPGRRRRVDGQAADRSSRRRAARSPPATRRA